jgi:hypothetical protein
MAGCKSCCSSGSCPADKPADDHSWQSKAQPQTKGPAANYYPQQQNVTMTPGAMPGTPMQNSWNTAPRVPASQAMQPDAVPPGSRSAYGVTQPMMVQQPMIQQPVYSQNPGAAIRQVPQTMVLDPSANPNYAPAGVQQTNNVYRAPAQAMPGAEAQPMPQSVPMDNAGARPMGDVYQAQNPAPAVQEPTAPMGDPGR